MPTYFEFGTTYETVWTTSVAGNVKINSYTNYGAVLEGVSAGASTIKAEVKYYVGETLTSFDPKVEETIVITATAE